MATAGVRRAAGTLIIFALYYNLNILWDVNFHGVAAHMKIELRELPFWAGDKNQAGREPPAPRPEAAVKEGVRPEDTTKKG